MKEAIYFHERAKKLWAEMHAAGDAMVGKSFEAQKVLSVEQGRLYRAALRAEDKAQELWHKELS